MAAVTFRVSIIFTPWSALPVFYYCMNEHSIDKNNWAMVQSHFANTICQVEHNSPNILPFPLPPLLSSLFFHPSSVSFSVLHFFFHPFLLSSIPMLIGRWVGPTLGRHQIKPLHSYALDLSKMLPIPYPYPLGTYLSRPALQAPRML